MDDPSMHAYNGAGWEEVSAQLGTTVGYDAFEWVGDTRVESQSFFDYCLADVEISQGSGRARHLDNTGWTHRYIISRPS